MRVSDHYGGKPMGMMILSAQRLGGRGDSIAYGKLARRGGLADRWISMSNHGARGGKGSGDLGPYWKRAHRDWRFWVGVLFMSVALIVYVMSDDLALVPRERPRQAAPAGVSR